VAADEAVLNTVHRKKIKKILLLIFKEQFLTVVQFAIVPSLVCQQCGRSA
jgi:hypothetical protein